MLKVTHKQDGWAVIVSVNCRVIGTINFAHSAKSGQFCQRLGMVKTFGDVVHMPSDRGSRRCCRLGWRQHLYDHRDLTKEYIK
jgi:hypothetical protein